MRKCPTCKLGFKEVTDLVGHIQEEHPDSIPKNFKPEQYEYYAKTGKTKGSCIICKNDTGWNEKTSKYHRFCKNPKCKEKYVAEFQKRMIGKHGKVNLLNDPEHQRKMLANRSISGKYKWSDGSKEFTYTGSYELDFLKFMDLFMEFDSSDIMSPSPHTYYYMYENKKRFYMPDFFIPSLNLEIEVKDGGGNENKHPKIQSVDKVKERLKDAVLTSQKSFSYIKVYNRNYDNFIDFLMSLKEDIQSNGEPKQKFYIEDWGAVSESYKEILTESYINYINGDDPEELEKSIESLKDGNNEYYQNEIIAVMENHLHVIKNYDYILKKVKDYDDELQVDYITTPRLGFELVYPGFINADICNMVKDLMETGDYSTFRRRIINKAKSVTESKKHFIRDLEVCKYVMKNYGDLHADKLELMNENYCWLDNVINEQVVTIGGDEMYPVYVLLTHTGTVLSNAIKSFTKKEYSHASISFDPSMNEMYSFGRRFKNNPLIGTFVREDITRGLYKDVEDKAQYALYVTFVTSEQKTLMLDRLEYFNTPGKSFKYNFIGLIHHALGKESAREEAFFCSQFVDTILSAGKQYFDRHSSLVQPTDFSDHPDFHFVSKGLIKDYDAVYTVKKTDLIASSTKINKKENHKVVYIPLSNDDIRQGWVKYLDGGKVILPTTYSSLKNLIKDRRMDSIYSHYMIVPLSKLNILSSNGFKELVVAITPLELRITNKNLI